MLSKREYGFKNEADIISYLNNKQFSELDEKWKKHILRMFPFVKDKDLIKARHYEEERGKPDMVITIRHTNMYVSIKTGRNSSIHQEGFESFANFLKSLNVSDRTIRIMSLFHFGQTDKLSNNGKPFTRKELEEKFGSYFLEASEELDKDEIIEKVIHRVVLKGIVQRRYKISYLYYGNLQTGYLLSIEDIYSLVLNYREHGKCPIHFGGLNFVPQQRSRIDTDFLYCRIRWPILAMLYYRSEEELQDIIDGKIKI